MPDATTAQAAAARRGLVSLSIIFVVIALLLFPAAGTLAWPLGWWFIAAFAGATLLSVAALWRLNPDIFVARSGVKRGTKRGDYIYIILLAVGLLGVFPVAALDYRFGWSAMPGWLVALGYALFFLGVVGQAWAQAVNKHFEPGVRIQDDRGQTVIDTGPYAIVRHPGYLTGSLSALSTAVMLGSWWALLPALIAAGALVPRTLFEEQTLHSELPGYTAYTQRVRWRWIPGVW